MRIPRIHADLPLTVGERIRLPGDAARHLVKVLRMGAGAEVEVFDGRGHACRGVLAGDGLPVEVELRTRVEADTESPLRITLAQSIAKGERMDYALQKAVELGIAEVQPLISERTIVRLPADRLRKREAHWRGVLISACEQAGRSRLPELLPALSLAEWLQGDPCKDQARGWVLNPRADASLASIPGPVSRGSLLIGPEGGLSDAEIEQAMAVGLEGVRLGPRILRTETAATVALSVLQSRFGDLV